MVLPWSRHTAPQNTEPYLSSEDWQSERAAGKAKRDLYQPIYKSLSKLVSGGGKSEVNEGNLNQGTHRLLCHVTFNPLLHCFCAKDAVKDFNRWSETFSDFGASWYHRNTRSDKFPQHTGTVLL